MTAPTIPCPHCSNEIELGTDERLMTVREVASLDGCDQSTVRKAMARGDLPSIRTRFGVRIPETAWRAWRAAA